MIFSRGTIVERLSGEAVTESNITSTVLRSTSVRDRAEDGAKGFVRWASGDSAPIIMVAIAVIVIGIVAALVNPTYLSARSLSGMMTLVATLAIVGYGQQLLMLVGGIDLSVGAVMGLVGVIASFFLLEDVGSGGQTLGWVLIIAVPIAIGLINFVLIEIVHLHPLIGTLATFMALRAVSLILRPLPEGLIDFAILDAIGYSLAFLPVVFIIAVVAGLGLEYLLFRHWLGISMRGHGSRPEAARLAGVAPRRTKLIAYVGCSSIAGLAGIVMIGQVGTGDARAGIGYTLTSIAAAVIGGASLFGGRGSFIAALFGAIFIIQVNQVTAFVRLDIAWSNYLLGAMILGAVALYSTSRKKAQAV